MCDEKRELEQNLAKKTAEIRKTLIEDVEKSVDKMKQDHVQQRGEN